jgi:Protein of unknown function (DUF1838)
MRSAHLVRSVSTISVLELNLPSVFTVCPIQHLLESLKHTMAAPIAFVTPLPLLASATATEFSGAPPPSRALRRPRTAATLAPVARFREQAAQGNDTSEPTAEAHPPAHTHPNAHPHPHPQVSAPQVSAPQGTFAVNPDSLQSDSFENLRGFVKTRGSLIPGEEVVFWWNGDIYGQDDTDTRDKHLFAFEGYNIGRMVKVSGGWRLLSREVGIYRDPITREILHETWRNPYSGEDNEVVHVFNDPVNNDFAYKVPTTVSGSDIYWHAEVPLCYPSPLPASEFPTRARSNMYQSLELFQFFTKADDLRDPSVPSASCQISWVRVGQWLPWMEMGDRTGRLVYHCRGKKLEDGYAGLSPSVRDFIEVGNPKYAMAPSDYTTPNETSWTYFKKLLSAKGSPRIDGTIAKPEPLAEVEAVAASNIRIGAKPDNISTLPAPDTAMTSAHLSTFNGKDVSKPILLGVGGLIFDVSSAKRHYRSGESYNCLTGRDATCAFISGDLSEAGLAAGTPRAGDPLTLEQKGNLEKWVGFFQSNYPQVGILAEDK